MLVVLGGHISLRDIGNQSLQGKVDLPKGYVIIGQILDSGDRATGGID